MSEKPGQSEFFFRSILSREVQDTISSPDMIDAIRSLETDHRNEILKMVTTAKFNLTNRTAFTAFRILSSRFDQVKSEYLIFYLKKYTEQIKSTFELSKEEISSESIQILRDQILQMPYPTKETFLRYYIMGQYKETIAYFLKIQPRNTKRHIENSLQRIKNTIPDEMFESIRNRNIDLTEAQKSQLIELADPICKVEAGEAIEEDLDNFLNIICYDLNPTQIAFLFEIEFNNTPPSIAAKKFGTTEGSIRAQFGKINSVLKNYLVNPLWWKRGEIGEHLNPTCRTKIKNTLRKILAHNKELQGKKNYSYFKEMIFLTVNNNWHPGLNEALYKFTEKYLTNTQKKRWQLFINGEKMSHQKHAGVADLKWVFQEIERFIIFHPNLSHTEKVSILGINFDRESFRQLFHQKNFQTHFVNNILKLVAQNTEESEILLNEIMSFLKMDYKHQKRLNLTPEQVVVLDLTINHKMGPKAIQEHINANPTDYKHTIKVPTTRPAIKALKTNALKNLAYYLRLNLNITSRLRISLFNR